jgi:hypothetical protein
MNGKCLRVILKEHKLNHVNKLHLYTCASKILTTQKNIYEFAKKPHYPCDQWWLLAKFKTSSHQASLNYAI